HAQAIFDSVAYTITESKTTEQVEFVLNNFPQARYHNGVLIEKVLQYWPYRNSRCIYDPRTQQVELKANIEDFFYIMKHAETITRLGRAYRAKHPEWNTSTVEAEREIQYRASKQIWYQEGQVNE